MKSSSNLDKQSYSREIVHRRLFADNPRTFCIQFAQEDKYTRKYWSKDNSRVLIWDGKHETMFADFLLSRIYWQLSGPNI